MEGFIGGALATLLFALLFVHLCYRVELFGFQDLMLCPMGRNAGLGLSPSPPCNAAEARGGLFLPRPLALHPGLLGSAARWLPSAAGALHVSDAQLHACVMGLFAAFIAPFGGFLASGFKRAFHIKDFSSLIPGHGGFTDRFDCQLLMGLFAYVYLKHVIGAGGEGGEGGSGPVGHFYASIKKSLSPAEIGELAELLRQLSER